MNEGRLEKNFSYVLFPFRYDEKLLETEGFNLPVSRPKGGAARLWEPDTLKTYHLKEGVARMLGAPGSAGSMYRLNEALRRELELPESRTELHFSCRGREKPSIIKLQKIALCLFKTGVGFLSLGFEFRTEDPWELLDINYFLCEVKSRDNRLRYEKRLDREKSLIVEFTLLEKVEKLLAGLAPEDFDAAPGLRYIDSKPLVFSYLLFARFPEDLGKLLFGLRTNFKASYQVPAEEYELPGAQNVLHPFENVYWGASLNGAVCCASLTGCEKTDEFFSSTFPSNLRQSYLPLFFLRQHQRFAVQSFQRRFILADQTLTGERPEEIQAAYKRVRALRERCVSFKLRCMYQDPSSVEHINAYDAFIARTTRVSENFAALEESLSQLDALAQGMRERIKDRQRRRERREGLRKERLLYMVTALWSSIVFLDSAWEIAEHFAGFEIKLPSLWVFLPLGLSLLPVISLAAEMKKKKQELEEIDSSDDEDG